MRRVACRRRPEYLLTGGRLEHYETFAAATDLALTADEREFLAASRRHDDELTAARRRRRTVLAGFAAAAVALVLAVVAVFSQQRAQDSADEADAQRIEAERQADLARDHERDALDQRDEAGRQRAEAETQQSRAEDQATLARSRELTASAIGVLEDDPDVSEEAVP